MLECIIQQTWKKKTPDERQFGVFTAVLLKIKVSCGVNVGF
jgi:hypothetical protein